MIIKGVEYGAGALLGDVLNVGFTVGDFNSRMKNGESTGSALAKSAGGFLAGEVVWSSVNQHIGGAVAKGVTGMAMKLGAKEAAAGVIGGVASFGATAAIMATQAGVQLASAHAQNTTEKMSKVYSGKGKFGSGYFEMSEAGYTMRQRSLNAIRSNGLNTQSVLGNEARTYYRGAV